MPNKKISKTKNTKKSKKSKKYYIEFSMSGLFFWSIGILLILAWIFALGIFVGRGMLPDGVDSISKYEALTPKPPKKKEKTRNNPIELSYHRELLAKKTAALENDVNHSNTSKSSKEPAIPPKKDEKKQAQVKKGSNLSYSRDKNKEKDKNEREKNRAKRVEKKNIPTSKKAPSSSVKPKNSPLYTVQLTSVTNRLEAIRFTNRLKEKGYPAFYTKARIKGRYYYRVRCGKFKDRAEAKKFRDILIKKERLSGFIARLGD